MPLGSAGARPARPLLHHRDDDHHQYDAHEQPRPRESRKNPLRTRTRKEDAGGRDLLSRLLRELADDDPPLEGLLARGTELGDEARQRRGSRRLLQRRCIRRRRGLRCDHRGRVLNRRSLGRRSWRRGGRSDGRVRQRVRRGDGGRRSDVLDLRRRSGPGPTSHSGHGGRRRKALRLRQRWGGGARGRGGGS